MNTQNMTDEEMRIAIAEACGFVKVHQVSEGTQVGHFWWKKDGINNNDIPDYLNSLDAMHVAMKYIEDNNKHSAFVLELDRVLSKTTPYEGAYYKRVNATARQRALAFLATLP